MSKVFVQLAISAVQALTFVIIGNSIISIKGMWFEYWLVLFSCWAGANILGLVISDTFKAVATIYMWIPFLVIPQIILSGIMVKFEKLNPNLSSPVSIPFYGEFITARWGYEALAVKQFKDNKYERLFYDYEKVISNANYKSSFWIGKIRSELQIISEDLKTMNKNEEFNSKLKVVYNELKKEQDLMPNYKFDFIEYLTPERITPEIISSTNIYLDLLRKAYQSDFNAVTAKKDALNNKLKSEDSKAYFKLRDSYINKSLEDFVKNKNSDDTQMVYERRGKIIRRYQPIYKDPDYKFIRAHFYAPQKNLFGKSVDTFIINVIVLWVMTIGLYLVLYFRLFKRLLESGETIIGKKPKGTE
jgi:hypothetical protein